MLRVALSTTGSVVVCKTQKGLGWGPIPMQLGRFLSCVPEKAYVSYYFYSYYYDILAIQMLINESDQLCYIIPYYIYIHNYVLN